MGDERRARWEDRTEELLAVLAVAFLVAYAWPILDPGIPQAWQTACAVTTWVTWGAFLVDYAVRLLLSVDRARFVRRHLLDLAAVILPVLRPLRMLRLLIVLNVLNRRASSSLRGRVAVYVTGAAFLVILVAALAVLDAERPAPGSNIRTFPDALWWAMTTVTTVGYGDHFPVTTTGKFVAVGLMLGGIALLGVVTASFASWLIERVQEIESESQVATSGELRQLAEKLDRLEQRLGAAECAETEPPAT